MDRGPAEAPPQATQQVTPTSQPREIAIRTGLADTLAPRQARHLAARDSRMWRAAMTTDLDDVRWGELQHNGGPAGDVPALMRRLRDGRRWQAALDELDNLLYHQGGWICSAASAAAPFLIALAADPEARCRIGVLDLVGRLAGETRRAQPEFVDDGWPAAWIGVVPALLRLLDDPDPAVRRASGVALASGSHDDRVSRALRTRWEIEDDPAARISLVFAVGDLARARAAHALPVTDEVTWLRGRVGHRDGRVGMAAVIASHWIAGGDRLPDGDVEVIVASVRGSEPESWDGVGQVPASPDALIGWVGRELRASCQAQLDIVTALAADPHAPCRQGALEVAAGVVTRWRSPTNSLLPLLAARLGDPEREIRALAAHILAAVGDAAAGHGDAMAALLRDSAPADDRETTIADIAVWGLARFGDPRCLPELCKRLGRRRLGFGSFQEHYTDSYLLWLPSIDEVLALVSPTSELLAALRKRMRATGDPDQRRALIRAVVHWGPAAERLAADLIALLDADDETAAPAAQALGAIGPGASASVPALERLAADARVPDRVRRRAALAAFRIAGDPLLVSSRLGYDLSADAAGACRMAAAIGRAAAAHAPRIRALLSSQDDWARVEAAHAVWRVTGEAAESVSILASTLDSVADGMAFPVTRPAARYLAAIGPEAAPAVPILRRLLADDRRHAYFGGWRAIAEDEELRAAVSEALARASA